jgi:tetratricopeptide (TPR) repeat protein
MAAIIYFRPQVLALYHQVRGGMVLSDIMEVYGNAIENNLACDLPPLEDEKQRSRLHQAIDHLETAVKYNQQLSQTYLLLGRAYCVLGEAENAISAYRVYLLLRPGNPLGHLEFALAYSQIGQKMSVIDWQAAGIGPEQMYARADLAFASQQYDTAGTWYQRAFQLSGMLDNSRQFRWAVSNILAGLPLPEGLDANAVSVYTLSQEVKISGEELQWLRPEDFYWNIRYGQRLYEHPTGYVGVGGLWWKGSGVAILQVPCTAEYEIQVSAMHKSAAGLSGQLQVEIDITPEANITLAEQWQEYETRITLTKGDHVFGIHYLNDVGDALIHWVSIVQIKACE